MRRAVYSWPFLGRNRRFSATFDRDQRAKDAIDSRRLASRFSDSFRRRRYPSSSSNCPRTAFAHRSVSGLAGLPRIVARSPKSILSGGQPRDPGCLLRQRVRPWRSSGSTMLFCLPCLCLVSPRADHQRRLRRCSPHHVISSQRIDRGQRHLLACSHATRFLLACAHHPSRSGESASHARSGTSAVGMLVAALLSVSAFLADRRHFALSGVAWPWRRSNRKCPSSPSRG